MGETQKTQNSATQMQIFNEQLLMVLDMNGVEQFKITSCLYFSYQWQWYLNNYHNSAYTVTNSTFSFIVIRDVYFASGANRNINSHILSRRLHWTMIFMSSGVSFRVLFMQVHGLTPPFSVIYLVPFVTALFIVLCRLPV